MGILGVGEKLLVDGVVCLEVYREVEIGRGISILEGLFVNWLFII